MPNGHIKDLGTHDIALRIAPDLKAVVQVVVVSQDENVDAQDENVDTSEEQTSAE
jgi:hypothetical protein